MYLFIYLLIYLCLYLQVTAQGGLFPVFTCVFIYLFIYLFIHSFIHSFIYLFIYLLIYLFIYLQELAQGGYFSVLMRAHNFEVYHPYIRLINVFSYNGFSSSVMWPPPLTLTRNEVHVFNPPKDNNCLFQSFIRKIEDLIGVNEISNEKLKAMRCQLMDYILEIMNSQHPFIELLTWGQIVEMQFMKADQSFMTWENYLHVMRSATPAPGDPSMMWGGELEIQVFAILYSRRNILLLWKGYG